MADDTSFQDLIRRVRAGEEQAVTELVRRYEPSVRRAVRFKLLNSGQGGAGISEDICQSVFLSLYLRLTAGQFDVEKPEQLEGLVKAMARNKLAFQQRKQLAQRRDRRRQQGGLHDDAFVDPGPSPSQQVAVGELLHEAQARLSPEEKVLVELRNQGLSWEEIAVRLGATPVALRKKLSRALDRLSRELGLAEMGEG